MLLQLIGWEHSCAEFRKLYKDLETPKAKNKSQRPNVFYQLILVISVALLGICILTMISVAYQGDWKCFRGPQLPYQIVFLVIVFTVLLSGLWLAWNWCRHLLNGKHSIAAMTTLWEKILRP